VKLDVNVELGPGHIVLDGVGPTQLPLNGAQPPPTFRPMSIVAKRSLISSTAEHLFLFRYGGQPS